MTEYSVEEVREWKGIAESNANLYTKMTGAHEPWTKLAGMLADLLERIKEDEGAMPKFWMLEDGTAAITEEKRQRMFSLGYPANNAASWYSVPLFLRPPAQAAQVDKPPQLGGCCCGEPCTLGVVHRTDGPCFHYVEPTAEPVAQGEFDAEARSHARMIHDFPRLSAFFQKHALGSKLPASCFACGHVGERAITHAELADIYVCKTCAEKIAKSPAKSAEPSTHPTTNSPETDSRLVGEPVAQDSSEPLRPGYVKCLKCDAQMGGYGYGEFPKLCPVCQNTSHAPAAEPVAQGGAVDIDTIALQAAEEIALMWGQDRSQFVAKIQVRIISALQRAHAAPHFSDASVLADWLESLHECHAGGAVGNRKWEPAQIAAKAVRESARPAERVPDGWRQALERALPFLDDEAGKYEDDGNNEPLDVADTIRDLLAAAQQADR